VRRSAAFIGETVISYNASLIPIDAKAVTPSDSVVVSFFGFYVGTTGDVKVRPSKEADKATPVDVVFTAVPAGSIIPLCVCRILNTGTTASNIVGFGPS